MSNNVYRDKDNTFRLLNRLRKNENIVVLSADKESCTVILNKTDYVNKVNEMINDGISKCKYVETVDSTHKDLKHFQDFLYRHFYKTKYYDGMRPISNQPARFFATAKTHKFDTIENINVKDLKLRPIIDQTGTYIYGASKVVAEFLKPLARNEFTISDTLAFPELLKNIENSDDYEDVSYDVESLFTSIPIKETIDYIIYKIYTKNVIEPMCKKSIFKKLLIKLTKECTFSVNNRLIKQIDGCPMGGPISVVFADIYMCKMENDVVAPIKPLFYKRYVDDTYVRRKKNTKDELFEKLNTYHKNIKLTTEENPTKFLDTEIVRHNSTIITKVYTRSKKFPVHWGSKIPLRYKRNAITGELHRANKIASNFSNEIKRIKIKYLQAGFPIHVINDVFRRFNQEKDEVLIPQWLFDDRKECLIRLPFAPANEKFVKSFINKLDIFTNYRVKFNIVWNTRKIKSLFNNKDKVSHYSCVIYRGICSCGADYIGETVRNAQLRWNEHENGTDKNSECAKHLNENDNHEFKWSILSLAPKMSFKRKILEAYFIKTLNPILNNQLNSDILTLFRNGVT